MAETRSHADLLRYDADALLELLRKGGVRVDNERRICCPMHNDEHPSANLIQSEKGVWWLRCHVCKESLDYWGAYALLNKTTPEKAMADYNRQCGGGDKNTQERPALAPQQAIQPQGGSMDGERKSKRFRSVDDVVASWGDSYRAHYCYSHPKTRQVELLIVRWWNSKKGKKEFCQYKPDPDCPGGFVMGAPEKPLPIYNRCRLAMAESAIVCEGEKAVHIFADVGFIATTSPGGAGNAAHADWSPLAGKDMVYIWPDNDEAGRKHAEQVREILERLSPAPSLRLIEPTEIGVTEDKGDVEQYLAMQGPDAPHEDKVAAIEFALRQAREIGPHGDLADRLEDIICGRRENVRCCHYDLSRLTQMFLPQTVTMFRGDRGTSKSWFVQEICYGIHFAGVKTRIYMLEDDRTFHLRRFLAQYAGCGKLMDEDWVKANPREVRSIRELNSEAVRSFGRIITERGREKPTYEHIIQWCREMSKEGARVLFIDPITMAFHGNKKISEADQELIDELKLIAKDHDNSIMLVTHPTKSAAGQPSQMAGGAALDRFSHTQLVIAKHSPPLEDVMLRTPSGMFPPDPRTPINRTVFIDKARNGSGDGATLAYYFDPGTFRHAEVGVIEFMNKKRKATR